MEADPGYDYTRLEQTGIVAFRYVKGEEHCRRFAFALDLLSEDSRVCCPKCNFAISRKRYDKLLNDGTQIVLHGVKYRIEYESQIQKHGRIIRKYAMGDPTIVEAAVAIIVSGVLGNAAYDAIKSTLNAIYAQLKKRRLKRRSNSSDRGICAQDADLVYKLIGNDPEFAERFIGYSKDYVNKRKSPTPRVADACDEEFVFDRYADICKNDPSIYVFSSQTGKRFHRKNCKALRPPTRRIRLKAAILTSLSPCRKCNPM